LEQLIKEDSEFCDHRGESDFGWFIALTQLLIERAQDGVGTDASECRHVQSTTQFGSTTGDVTPAFAWSTVIIVVSDADQRSNLALAQRAQLWAQSHASGSGNNAHSLGLLQAEEILLEDFFVLQERTDGRFQLGDLPIQEAEPRAI
jgi:hypothetical protein